MSAIRSVKNVVANGKKQVSSTVRLTQEEYKEKYDKRVEQFERDFPPLSGVAEKVAPEVANAVIKGLRAAKYEITQRHFELEKEKLEKKRKSLHGVYLWREQYHVRDLKQHFGENYFDYVEDTQYDCDEAIYQRRKREEEEEIRYWDIERREEIAARRAEEEEQRLIESLNDDQRKRREMEEYYNLSDQVESDELAYYCVMDMAERELEKNTKKRNELLKTWHEKQAKKPKHLVWNYSVELERRKV